MNRFLLRAFFVATLVSASVFGYAAFGQAGGGAPVAQLWCYVSGPVTSPTSWLPCSSTTPLAVTGSFTPSGTQNVNITQILGAAPSLTNPLYVSPATGASFAVTGAFWPYTLGQQLAAASVPVVLTAAQISTLTPPTSINQGNAGSNAQSWWAQLGDTTNGPVAVKAPSTASPATDKSLSVTLNAGSNGIIATGTAGSPASQVVTTQGISGGQQTPVVNIGTANLAAGQVSVGSTATLIVAARTGVQGTGRKTVCVTNSATTAVFLGGSGVTTSTGQLLPGTTGAQQCWDTQAAIYGIVSTGSETVSYSETY
jgi:hypothetical protein